MTDQQNALVAALATIIDAISTNAPRDFLEAACKDGAIAIEATTRTPFDELPPHYFTWGKTSAPDTSQS